MPTAAQRAAMRAGPARDTESVATSRSQAEVVEIPVPKAGLGERQIRRFRLLSR